MSDFHVEVCILENVRKHPNADTLSMGTAAGSPVIFRTGEYTQGEQVVYIPVNSIMPETPEWEFLGSKKRIRAKKLRGIFSCGMIAKSRPEWVVGQNVQAELDIEKYDPDAEFEFDAPRAPKERFSSDKSRIAQEMFKLHGLDGVPLYGVAALRKYDHVFQPGDEVVAFEKIHGQNARYVYSGDRLYVSSKCVFRPVDGEDTWSATARRYDLANKLSDEFSDIVIYCETYGNNDDLHYNVRPDADRLIMFDAYNRRTGEWYNWRDSRYLAKQIGLAWVPEVYRGPYYDGLAAELADGPSMLADGKHFREGVVIRHVDERYDHVIGGRVVMKAVGQQFLLRNKA